MKETIRQMFLKYGFKDTKNSFHRMYRNGFILVKCPENLKLKSIRAIDNYIENKKIIITSKDTEGKNVNYFIGFWQGIRGFRKPAVAKFSPSQLHCKEMKRFAEGNLLNF